MDRIKRLMFYVTLCFALLSAAKEQWRYGF
ncbi:MAG: hypothetical protein ACJAWL_003707 [Motiliproteus sp.]|jgi:hypothetical protein